MIGVSWLSCSTGKSGVCAFGTTACSGGAIVCNQNTAATQEVCDGLDNDCNGVADDSVICGTTCTNNFLDLR